MCVCVCARAHHPHLEGVVCVCVCVCVRAHTRVVCARRPHLEGVVLEEAAVEADAARQLQHDAHGVGVVGVGLGGQLVPQRLLPALQLLQRQRGASRVGHRASLWASGAGQVCRRQALGESVGVEYWASLWASGTGQVCGRQALGESGGVRHRASLWA